MTISSALANANSGLAAAQRRADLVSNNIANALTPGYARRDIAVSERVVDGRGAGVAIDGQVRANDPVLTGERRRAEGVVGREQAVAAAYQSFNQALGEADDPYSLFGQYQGLETALRGFAETPNAQAYQAQTLDAAKSLAVGLNDLSANTQRMRENADAAIAKDVSFVNTTLKQIEELNRDIVKMGNGGRDIAALEDQRKTLIDQVSAIVPVREVPREGGALDLMTNEGVFLIAGKAREIEFNQTGVITADLAYDGGAGVLSGLSVNGTDITPGGSGSMTIRQGTLAGRFAVRDDIAPQFQAQIDGLARDLIERFTDIDPTLASGEPGLFTDAGAPFDPANETGLAGRIAVNAAVDPDQGGALHRLRDGFGAASEGVAGNDTFIRTQLDALTEQRMLPAGTGIGTARSAAEAAGGVASLIGAARLSSESSLTAASARAEAVIDAETAATAVDTDAEMQKLLQIEQAFAANARVLQTAQDMIQILMEL